MRLDKLTPLPKLRLYDAPITLRPKAEILKQPPDVTALQKHIKNVAKQRAQ